MRPLGYIRDAIKARVPMMLPEHEALRAALARLSADDRHAVDRAADGALNGTADDAALELLARVAKDARAVGASVGQVAQDVIPAHLPAAAPNRKPRRESPPTAARRSAPAHRATHEALAALPKVRIATMKAGAVFEMDRLRSHDDAGDEVGGWTLRAEAARAAADGVDWSRKIALQVMREELPLLIAVIMGWRQVFEVRHHGFARNKSMRLENQDGGVLFLDLREGARGAAVPIGAGHRFDLAMLCANVLDRNHREGGATVGLDVLRDIAHLL